MGILNSQNKGQSLEAGVASLVITFFLTESHHCKPRHFAELSLFISTIKGHNRLVFIPDALSQLQQSFANGLFHRFE